MELLWDIGQCLSWSGTNQEIRYFGRYLYFILNQFLFSCLTFQVVILHHMLSKSTVKARPSVLWCYKKELGFSSHRKKRMKSLQQKIKSGKLNVNEDDPFELFVASTNIRYCYYHETHKILGNTYGMCILQVIT